MEDDLSQSWMRVLKCKKFPQSSFFAVTNGSRSKIKSRRVETAPINSRVVNYRERRAKRNVRTLILCVIECKSPSGPKVRAVTWAAFKTFRDPYPAWKNLKKAGYILVFVRARHHEGHPAHSQGRLFIRTRCTRISLNALYIPRQWSSSSSSIVTEKHRNGRPFREFYRVKLATSSATPASWFSVPYADFERASIF